MSIILGVQPDVPTETNERGGKQSATPYAFHFLPQLFGPDYLMLQFPPT